MPAMCRILFGPSFVLMAWSRRQKGVQGAKWNPKNCAWVSFWYLSCVKNTWKDFDDFLKLITFCHHEVWKLSFKPWVIFQD